jgi:antitoxin MazE
VDILGSISIKDTIRALSLPVAKWGNSLALRIPTEYVRAIGIKEGDRMEARLTIDGGLALRAARWDRKAFARELEAARESMAMGHAVIEELRRDGR